MPDCSIVPAADRFSSDIIAFLDCNALTLGESGYRALAAPGSSASVLLTIMLTIFVGMVGYRLLLGDTLTLREGVLSIAKVGVVLALATSWPAYQTLIFDVVLREPANLVAQIGGPAGLPSATGELPARLDAADQQFRTLAIIGTATSTFDPSIYAPGVRVPPMFSGYDIFAVSASRLVFLFTALAGFALVRLAAGLLLALGPLFVTFLLFEHTRALFDGWLRALVGVAISGLATSILLSIELALLQPWLSDLVSRRPDGYLLATVATPMLATTISFAIVLGGLLCIAARIASSLTVGFTGVARLMQRGQDFDRLPRRQPESFVVGMGASEQRSRALAVADSVASAQRREEQQLASGRQPFSGSSRSAHAPDSSFDMASRASVSGNSISRRTSRRRSASAAARDHRV